MLIWWYSPNCTDILAAHHYKIWQRGSSSVFTTVWHVMEHQTDAFRGGVVMVRATVPYHRSESRFAPSQWETALLCNDVSHWLGQAYNLGLRPASERISYHPTLKLGTAITSLIVLNGHLYINTYDYLIKNCSAHVSLYVFDIVNYSPRCISPYTTGHFIYSFMKCFWCKTCYSESIYYRRCNTATPKQCHW